MGPSKEVKTCFAFSSFGVDVCLEFLDGGLLERFKESLALVFRDVLTVKDPGPDDHLIQVGAWTADNRIRYRFEGDDLEFNGSESQLFRLLRTLVRVTVAGYARDKLFIHAGAVSFNGRGLIVPAQSNAGKTTLVAELCRLGADYYSDEYAVVDGQGVLFPFPKHLSIRGDGGRFDQREVEITEIGGAIGSEPVPVHVVLFCDYKSSIDIWSTTAINTGEALLRLVPHMIPFPKDPAFALGFGRNLVRNASLLEGVRGEVKEFAPKILELLDKS